MNLKGDPRRSSASRVQFCSVERRRTLLWSLIEIVPFNPLSVRVPGCQKLQMITEPGLAYDILAVSIWQQWASNAVYRTIKDWWRGVWARHWYVGLLNVDSRALRNWYCKFTRCSSFYPRDAMLARVIAIATCPSVRHAPVLCQKEES